MKTNSAIFIFMAVINLSYSATDFLKRKVDIHTFSLNGEYSNTSLSLKKTTSNIETNVLSMSFDLWSDQKKRVQKLGLLQKKIEEGKNVFSFPVLILNKSKNEENVLLGSLNKNFASQFNSDFSSNNFYVTLIKKNKTTHSLPLFDFYLSKLNKSESKDSSTYSIPKGSQVLKIANLNMGKFLFQSVALMEHEQIYSCINDIQRFFAEFSHAGKRIRSKKALKSIKDISITNIDIINNSTGPGNYQLKLLGSVKGKPSTLLSGYFHLPYPFYNLILKHWSGKTPVEYGIVKDRLALNTNENQLNYLSYPRYGDTSPFQSNTVPTCHIRNLKPFTDNSDKKWTPYNLEQVGHETGSVASTPNLMKVDEGSFSTIKDKFSSNLESELFIKINKRHAPGSFLKRHKSRGYALPSYYLERVNGDLVKKPTQKSVLKSAKNGRDFWAKARKIKNPVFVLHRFDNFREMFGTRKGKNGVAKGGFWNSRDPNILIPVSEVDGRNGANLEIDDFKSQRIWPSDLSFIQRMAFFKAFIFQYQGGESSINGRFIPPDDKPRVEITLSCHQDKTDWCKGKIHNLVMGNISLEPGQDIILPMGIGTEPSMSSYGKDSLKDFKPYALTYNKQGYITDHLSEIGSVRVSRAKSNEKEGVSYTYSIEILAPNNSHILSKTTLDLKKSHIDFERKKVLNSRTVGLKK